MLYVGIMISLTKGGMGHTLPASHSKAKGVKEQNNPIVKKGIRRKPWKATYP